MYGRQIKNEAKGTVPPLASVERMAKSVVIQFVVISTRSRRPTNRCSRLANRGFY